MIRALAVVLLAGPAAAGSEALEAALSPALAQAYPEFAAGLVDCLSFNAEGHDADIGEDGQVLGEGFSYSIFYPALKQPYDFVVAVSSSGGILNCSGQGPVSMPMDDPLWSEVETLMTAAGMVELNFPPPSRSWADCAGERATLFSDNGGRVLFAAFTGPNASSYCTNFAPKE